VLGAALLGCAIHGDKTEVMEQPLLNLFLHSS